MPFYERRALLTDVCLLKSKAAYSKKGVRVTSPRHRCQSHPYIVKIKLESLKKYGKA